MSMVMLHADSRNGLRFGPLRREIIRMQIASERGWFEAIEPAEFAHGFCKGLARCRRIEVADMRTKDRLASGPNGDGRFEMPARSHDRRQCCATSNLLNRGQWQRRVAPA